MQLLDVLRDNRCQHIAPSTVATQRFTADVVDSMKDTIWVTGCDSWYLDSRGVPITWPWKVQEFADSMRAVNFDDYDLVA